MHFNSPVVAEITGELIPTMVDVVVAVTVAATVAVETVIDQHYGEQAEALADGADPELAAMGDDVRADEVEHRETAAAHSGKNGFPVMQAVIRAGCRAAIAVAKRV